VIIAVYTATNITNVGIVDVKFVTSVIYIMIEWMMCSVKNVWNWRKLRMKIKIIIEKKKLHKSAIDKLNNDNNKANKIKEKPEKRSKWV
jgi:hypothetical protein